MGILALDIGGTAIKSGYFENGSLTGIQETASRASQGAAALTNTVNGIIDAHVQSHSVDRVGLSVSGQINPTDGSILFATDSIPGFTGTPFLHNLQKRHCLPIAIDNDVNSAALGEAFYGAAKAYHNFLCITYGTGIGGAIVIDRKIYYGKIGIAGELGHMITHADGKSCVCGKRGCYEAYASTSALIAEVREKTGRNLNGREIFESFHLPVMHDAIDHWVDEIVYGLASLIHIFNPQALLLGGGILEQSYVYEEIVRKTKNTVIPSFSDIDIIRASLGNRAGIYGAYHNALQI